jgi:hypothetical protein
MELQTLITSEKLKINRNKTYWLFWSKRNKIEKQLWYFIANDVTQYNFVSNSGKNKIENAFLFNGFMICYELILRKNKYA